MVIDFSVIEELKELQTDGEPDIIHELIDAFLEAAPEHMETIRKAAIDGAARDLQSAAHALRGSSSAIGAIPLSESLQKLEDMGKGNDLSSATAEVTRAEALLKEAETALSELRSRGNPK